MKTRQIIIIGSAILILFTILILSIVLPLFLKMKDIELSNHGLLDELRSSSEQLARIQQNLTLVNQDTNVLRGAFHLPPRSYPPLLVDEQSTEETNVLSLFLDAIKRLEGYEQDIEAEKVLYSLLQNNKFQEGLKAGKLTVVNETSMSFLLNFQGKGYFTFSILPRTREIMITDSAGGSFESLSYNREMEDYLKERIPEITKTFKLIDDFQSSLKNLPQQDEFKSFLRENRLYTQFIPDKENLQILKILNNDDEIVGEFYLDTRTPGIQINGTQIRNPENLSSWALEALRKRDIRTAAERRIDAANELILSLAKEVEFVLYLEGKGLRLEINVRDDNDYYYYDLIEEGKGRIGSFAVQKMIGKIYLMDKDDVPISSFSALENPLPDLSKKKLATPDQDLNSGAITGSAKSVTFLLCGSHELNADTMILVHADGGSGKVTMVGVPRDIYYRGRKINGIYRSFGPAQLIKELSKITGLPISRYIVIDMYAFIDTVNILGGIDITLEEDLIDPTYRIKERGQWSTLYYPKGTYHLNGIQALRVARSRHTSDDFERSKRQQQILMAVKDKIISLGVSDIDRAYNILKSLLSYVDTNFTLFELLDLFLSHKSSLIDAKNVLDTENVLYATYTNTYFLEDDSELLKDENYDKGAWILLPKDNNWNEIKIFLANLIGARS